MLYSCLNYVQMVQGIIGFFFFLLHDQHYFMSKKSCLILNNFSYYIHCNGHDFLNINRSPLPLLIGLTTVCPRSLVPLHILTYYFLCLRCQSYIARIFVKLEKTSWTCCRHKCFVHYILNFVVIHTFK